MFLMEYTGSEIFSRILGATRARSISNRQASYREMLFSADGVSLDHVSTVFGASAAPCRDLELSFIALLLELAHIVAVAVTWLHEGAVGSLTD